MLRTDHCSDCHRKRDIFDAYTVLAIAYAMPVLAGEWNLTPGQIGTIISAGYVGQIFGALLFGWLAERIGRLNVLLITVVIFTSMDFACLFAWDATSMMSFRFVQGIGTGGDLPVASAYMNEFVSAKRRGRFFLLYEVLFLVGLAFRWAHRIFPRAHLWLEGDVYRRPHPGHSHNPDAVVHGESPRWLLSVGRIQNASDVVARMENGLVRRGKSQNHRSLWSIRSTRLDQTYASFSKELTSDAPPCWSHCGFAHT